MSAVSSSTGGAPGHSPGQIILYRSNRTEALVGRLANLVKEPGLDPFVAETIVVEGRGMGRWLSMQLADQIGIWANPHFLSLRGLLDQVSLIESSREVDSAFDPETLMWSIADLLPGLMVKEEFQGIRHYLSADDSGIRRIQLAYKIADTYYKYTMYRPEMLAAWREDKPSDPDEVWQAVLWRALIERLGEDHLPARTRKVVEALMAGESPATGLPERVFVFGTSTLPPLYLELLIALSRVIDVHLFLLSPSREFWGDILTPAESRRVLRRGGEIDEDLLYLDEGHPLLASLGRQGRDFFQILESQNCTLDDGRDLYRSSRDESPRRSISMLLGLQDDILDLRIRGSEDHPAQPFDCEDHSIRLHSCHTAMREVEVLREELLACFEAHPDLEPQDVVVLTPDIGSYTPYIEAVFGTRSRNWSRGTGAVGRGEGSIPYRIADRGPLFTNEVASAFGHSLDFATGRFAVAAGLDLLAIDCVRSRFGIEPGELDTVREWLSGSGIRWGADSAHRESLDQPANAENTWQFGLDRLLLGYALPDENDALYCGVRPMNAAEGGAAELLGKVVEFFDFLVRARSLLTAARTPSEWCSALGDHLEGIAESNDDNAHQHHLLRDEFEKISRRARRADFNDAVTLEAIRDQLDRGLSPGSAIGFLSGGVTFCELVPMRSIPFRVVCLIGMNDDAFPRIHRPLGFDLIAKFPRLGDRSSREDDRYLFLEALLSARDRLIITYVGQGIRDGASLPPSVVVSELLDTLADSVSIPDTKASERRRAIRTALVITHPLQPFSPQYFKRDAAPQLLAHSAFYRDAAARLIQPREKPPAFLESALPESEPDLLESQGNGVEEIDFLDLLEFFDHPVKYFMRRRLGVALIAEEEVLSEREPFTLRGLDQWLVKDEILRRLLSGSEADEIYSMLRAGGVLPLGLAGKIRCESLLLEVEPLAEACRELREGDPLDDRSFEIDLDEFRIRGQLRNLWPKGRLQWGVSDLAHHRNLSVWVHHLVLNAESGEGALPRRSYWVGKPEKAGGSVVAHFGEVQAPGDCLRELVSLYQLGQKAPLPLLKHASRAYAIRQAKGDSEEEALAKARKRFEGSDWAQGDAKDPYVELAFGDLDVMDPTITLASGLSFGEVANRVWLPLLDALGEGL